MKCPVCGKKMKDADVELRGFALKGFKCSCGETAFNPLDVEMVRKAVNGNVKARRVANSLVITLPRPLARLARIKEGDVLNWLVSKNRLILQKS